MELGSMSSCTSLLELYFDSAVLKQDGVHGTLSNSESSLWPRRVNTFAVFGSPLSVLSSHRKGLRRCAWVSRLALQTSTQQAKCLNTVTEKSPSCYMLSVC